MPVTFTYIFIIPYRRNFVKNNQAFYQNFCATSQPEQTHSCKKRPALSSKTPVSCMQKLFRSSISRSPQTKSTYASTMPRCPSSARSAEILLLCTLAMGMEFFFAAFTAPCTILWDTVRVNRIIRSGEPIFFSMGPVSFGNTFAVQPCAIHTSAYWRLIHSFPPIITTLIGYFHLTKFLGFCGTRRSPSIFLAAKQTLVIKNCAFHDSSAMFRTAGDLCFFKS